MFGSIINGWSELGNLDQNDFMRLLEGQMDLQERALEAQIALNEAQIAYMNARTDALDGGDSLIKKD